MNIESVKSELIVILFYWAVIWIIGKGVLW